jgi:hypothetical protein
MFCGECGATIDVSEEFCSACGSRVVVEKPRAATNSEKASVAVLGITRTVLGALADGKVIRNSVAVAMQVLAAITILGGIFVLVELLKMSFQFPSAQGTIGGLILTILILAAVFATSQIWLYRAQSVRQLPDSPFTIIPILSLLFRALGEIYAIVGLAAGVGGCLFMWFSGFSPQSMLGEFGSVLPHISSGNQSFIDGLVFMLWLSFASFAALVVCYGLAELVVVAVDIATNIRLLVKKESAEPAYRV